MCFFNCIKFYPLVGVSLSHCAQWDRIPNKNTYIFIISCSKPKLCLKYWYTKIFPCTKTRTNHSNPGRRTQSINNAYADLRDCIPNVPADTKLSKIKTLRLATSYILYLIGVLETDDPAGGFRAELGTMSRKNAAASNGNAAAVATEECATAQAQQKSGAQVRARWGVRLVNKTWRYHKMKFLVWHMFAFFSKKLFSNQTVLKNYADSQKKFFLTHLRQQEVLWTSAPNKGQKC